MESPAASSFRVQPSEVSPGGGGILTGKRLWLLSLIALIIYSIAMIGIEVSTSQDYVRRYFTDIGHPYKQGFFAAPDSKVIFFAVNTSLSAFLLGCSGVILLFASFAAPRPPRNQTRLYAAQAFILLYLSMDDRFMFHERIGAAVGLRSSVILLIAGAVNLAVYIFYFRPEYFSPRMAKVLVVAGGFFFGSMILDVFAPHYMVARLSSEDLLKTWAGFWLLTFSWEAARFRLLGQPHGERGFVVPARIRRYVPSRWR
jgi:hypothetical protein